MATEIARTHNGKARPRTGVGNEMRHRLPAQGQAGMTGPEHYAEAQRLAARAQGKMRPDQAQLLAALAQVHATLAFAAATVDAALATVENTRVDDEWCVVAESS